MLFSSCSLFFGQEIKSIYVKVNKVTFSNHYKNYAEYDSIYLYKDSSFRKSYAYLGFDELNKTNFIGKWKIKNKNLHLYFQKRDDSSKIVEIEPFEEIIKLRKLTKDFKKLK